MTWKEICDGNNPIIFDIRLVMALESFAKEINESVPGENFLSFHDKKLFMARESPASITHFKAHDGELIPIDEFADYITAHHKKS